MSNKQWEFHFRNFDAGTNWFSVHHFGCGGIPWHDGRAQCWFVDIPNNPTGGHSSVYVPATFIVKSTEWIKVFISIFTAQPGDILSLGVSSEGEDLGEAIGDMLGVSKGFVEDVSHDIGHDLGQLTKNAEKTFAASCSAVGKTPDQIRAIAVQLGLSSKFGFIAGDAYQKYIRLSNPDTNDDAGFSIMHAPSDAPVDHACTAAFIHNGALILYWNSNDLNGFWSTDGHQ